MTPRRLARAIDRGVRQPLEERPALDLDGAETSARMLAELAARAAPEDARVRAHRHGQLGVQAFLVDRQDREIAVRGPAGNDLKMPRLEQRAEGARDVVPVLLDETSAQVRVAFTVELHHGLEVRIAHGALELFVEHRQAVVQITQVPLLQQRIGHHGQQRRGERHRDAIGHAVACQTFEDVEQGQVGLGQRFEEPVFLKKAFVFRVAHKR